MTRSWLCCSLLTLSFATLIWQANPASCDAFIKLSRFDVPIEVRVGDSARLRCVYELANGTLHAMKLFKDDKEFYRFSPKAEDSVLVRKLGFPVSGVQVDLARSNGSDVLLRNITKEAEGKYKCQVSIEGTFKSLSKEQRMAVAERTGASGSSPSASASASAESQWAKMMNRSHNFNLVNQKHLKQPLNSVHNNNNNFNQDHQQPSKSSAASNLWTPQSDNFHFYLNTNLALLLGFGHSLLLLYLQLLL